MQRIENVEVACANNSMGVTFPHKKGSKGFCNSTPSFSATQRVQGWFKWGFYNALGEMFQECFPVYSAKWAVVIMRLLMIYGWKFTSVHGELMKLLAIRHPHIAHWIRKGTIGIWLWRRNLPSSRYAPAKCCSFEMLEPCAECSKKGGFNLPENKQEKFHFISAACENCFTSLMKRLH